MAQVQKVLTVGTLCSIFIILVSIFFKRPDDELHARLTSVVQGLIEVEGQYEIYKPKVAVGYGACHDLLVNAVEFLEYDDTTGNPEHYDDINSVNEFKQMFSYYFRHGAASERFMPNSTLFDELVNKALKSQSSHFAIGGNAALMAQRLYNEGSEVVLAAAVSPDLKKSLPDGIKVVGGETSRDDIHLILEYKAGESWGPYTSPRANRFIVHNDNNNPLISSLEYLEQELNKFNPDLLIVSGLQMMDNFPFQPGERVKRLLRVREQMISQPSTTRIHFEMASFVESELLHQLMEHIIPFADSLGMNEQELSNIVSVYQYGNVSLVSDSNPRVATVLDQMRLLMKLIHSSNVKIKDRRKLTRIHVHTLAYQTILTVGTSEWKYSHVAVAKASLTAYRHVCASDQVDLDKAVLIMDDSFSVSVNGPSKRVVLEPKHPVSCWIEGSHTLCVAPVLVCTNTAKTAGGGDNISAAALSVQL